MQTQSAKDAKYSFGRLIDTARAEPVTIEKHRRAVVVVLAIEEYERLKTIELGRSAIASSFNEKAMRRGEDEGLHVGVVPKDNDFYDPQAMKHRK